jgi:hypothetical protein
VCLDSIDAEMSELPNHIASLQQDLDTRARELERLKALLPTYHQYSSLLGELGPLKGKVAQLHAEAGAAGDAVRGVVILPCSRRAAVLMGKGAIGVLVEEAWAETEWDPISALMTAS